MEVEKGACCNTTEDRDKFINLIVLGMAGSGKTTFVHRLTTDLTTRGTPPYVVNLDPACRDTPYKCNIDIRDTIKYKEVMKSYGLGPNGAIVTSLNLFATKLDQMINLIEKKKGTYKYVIYDSPGQIEVFNWSASGTIITDTLASQFPTVVAYVMDTVRSENPTTFMSNMIYACSILFKSKLPLIVVLNKIDAKDCGFAKKWMSDFEAYDEAVERDESYVANLSRSMSLVMDEFYKTLSAVGVSSVTGEGIVEFLGVLDVKEKEYFDDYKVEYDKLKREKVKMEVEETERKLMEVKMDVGSGDEVRMGGLKGERMDLGVVLGGGEDEGEGDVGGSEDEEEKHEYESFKVFLEREKSKM